MLYREGGQDCKENLHSLNALHGRAFVRLACGLAALLLFAACSDHVDNPNRNLQLSHYDGLKEKTFALNSRRIRQQLNNLIAADSDSLMADYRTRSYYTRRGDFLWIDRHGIDWRADTLVAYLKGVKDLGFNPEKFRLPEIERDLKRLRSLDVDSGFYNINKVAARLEYNLTKGYLRYALGQRFGYVNPRYVFNRLDVLKEDSAGVISYRGLYDVDQDVPGKNYFNVAFRQLRNDSLGLFLQQIQPHDALFSKFREMLSQTQDPAMRRKILVNMERCRWRVRQKPQQGGKYVLVNIPSYRLRAVDGDKSITMRVGVGTLETKTPLLTSNIKRMDVNPNWVIPQSIIEKSIMHHAGDSVWFARRRYFVMHRFTGKRVPLRHVTYSMLASGDYSVAQEGGEGNSLGRIIFRFDNNFAVYLHDTSSREVFGREDRGVSHGCVRVEHPFELAAFLLGDDNAETISRIAYSMTADLSPLRDKKKDDDEEAEADTLQRKKLIWAVPVKPQIPLFITYFTLFPNAEDGQMASFDDVYGYDEVLWKGLRNYIR